MKLTPRGYATLMIVGVSSVLIAVLLSAKYPPSKQKTKSIKVEEVELDTSFKPLILPVNMQICREACLDRRLHSITSGDVNLGASESDIVTSVDKYCKSLMEDSSCFKIGRRQGDKNHFENQLQFWSSSIGNDVAIVPNTSELKNDNAK
jgi:hypothetical protein